MRGTPCRRCGGPKEAGQGQAYCIACRRAREAERNACPRCGRPRTKKHAHLCTACRKASYVAGYRKRNRESRRPCSACGKRKATGKGNHWCKTCQAKLARRPRMCKGCGERPPRGPYMRYCATCRPERVCYECGVRPPRAKYKRLCASCIQGNAKRARERAAAYAAAKRRLAAGGVVILDEWPSVRRAARAARVVDTEPFVAYLRAAFPDFDASEIAALFGTTQTGRVRKLLAGETPRIRADHIDAMLTHGLGRPDLFDVLYEGVAA